MLFRERITRFSNRVFKTKNGIWTPDAVVPIHQNVLAIIENDHEKLLFLGHNIISDFGDIFYAQEGAGEAPTDTYTEFTVSTNAWSPVPGKATDSDDLVVSVASGTANLAFTGGYPKSNDTGDADNTGDGVDVVSWAVLYGKAAFNDPSIEGVTIHETGAVFGAAAADPVLMSANLTSFGKTADDTLKIFVNHTMNGV